MLYYYIKGEGMIYMGCDKLYNVVNTLFPIGIFLVSIMYMFGSVKNEIVNESFNFKIEQSDKKVFESVILLILLAGFFIGIVPAYFFYKNIKYITIINNFTYIYFFIMVVIQIIACKWLKEDNIIKLLTQEIGKFKNLIKITQKGVIFISGIILGCNLYLILNNISGTIEFLTILVIYIIINFILVSLCTLLKNICNIKNVVLLDKNGNDIAIGKVFKIVDDFIVVIQQNKSIKFINKNEVNIIKYMEGINMNEEQIKDITITLIEKGMLYAGENNEDTAIEIAKFINKLREETNK